MADAPRLITAVEMDQMTPNERAAVVEAGIGTDLDELPEHFRAQVVATAMRLSAELGQRAH